MITVYELERRVPSYYGLCGLKMEKAIYVRSYDYYTALWSSYRIDIMRLEGSGRKIKRERDFPTKLITGGFIRRIN